MKKANRDRIHRIALQSLIMIGAFVICTGICLLLDFFKLNDLNYLLIYVLGILLTAVFTQGYLYSLLLSAISVLGYNFFLNILIKM